MAVRRFLVFPTKDDLKKASGQSLSVVPDAPLHEVMRCGSATSGCMKRGPAPAAHRCTLRRARDDIEFP
jgi:hypothetical protein